MTGGGMIGGGMTGGGMTGGGMMGGGMTGVPGGLPGYADPPIHSGVTSDTGGGQSYDTNGTNATGLRSRKIYHCVTPNGRCAVGLHWGPTSEGRLVWLFVGRAWKDQTTAPFVEKRRYRRKPLPRRIESGQLILPLLSATKTPT
jgi:hypothetical protein